MLNSKKSTIAAAILALAAGAAFASETRIDYTGQQSMQSRAEVVDQLRTAQARNGGVLPSVDEAWGEVEPMASAGEPVFGNRAMELGGDVGFVVNEAWGGFTETEGRYERGE